MDREAFTSKLNIITQFRDIADFSQYTPLPETWYVAVTDVVDSTNAIDEGRYQEVNILGASAIIGCLNAAGGSDLPYAFGGDGAAICIPPELYDQVCAVLAHIRLIADEAYGLDLRVGIIAVSRILTSGSTIKVAKLRISDLFSQTLFTGGGLDLAEDIIKQDDMPNHCQVPDSYLQYEADFSGLECRWQEVPSRYDETNALLIKATKDTPQKHSLYQQIIEKIEHIYGEDPAPHPLTEDQLTMGLNPFMLMGELKIRTFGQNVFQRFLYLLKMQLQIILGKIFMRTGWKSDATDWSLYKPDLVAHADYRKFDDMLRMVLVGTANQRHELEAYLDTLHTEERLAYGIHTSSTALITCMVFQYHREHLHFIDGSNGGYANAARQMKRQLRKLNQ